MGTGGSRRLPVNPLLEASAPLVIGHRGAAAEAPENTLPSFSRALEREADALELDVHVTADGVPVVIHDATLERTTDRTGPVAAVTLKQLGHADAGARFTPDGGRTFPWRGRGVTVPTLAEVLAATKQTPLIVEVKDPAGAGAVRAVLERQRARQRCVLGSFHAAALVPFREAGYATAGTRGEVAKALAGALVGLAPHGAWQVLTVPEYYRGIPLAAAPLLRAVARSGRPVHVWTVDDPVRAGALWRRGATGIITNDPGKMTAARPMLP